MGPLGELNELIHKHLTLDKCQKRNLIINQWPITNMLPLQLKLCHSQKESRKCSSVFVHKPLWSYYHEGHHQISVCPQKPLEFFPWFKILKSQFYSVAFPSLSFSTFGSMRQSDNGWVRTMCPALHSSPRGQR